MFGTKKKRQWKPETIERRKRRKEEQERMMAKFQEQKALRRMSTPFDRKANYGDMHPMVDRLRRRGWTRRVELGRRERTNNWKYPNKWYGVESSAMIELMFEPLKGKTFLDIGCGYSPDAYIAKQKGATAYRLDLYETPAWDNDAKLLIADYCEKIPLATSSVDVIVAAATLNLNSKSDRLTAYKEIKRVLKKGGLFSFYMCSLLNEHDWDLKQERETLHKLGFEISQNFNGGSVMQLVRKRN